MDQALVEAINLYVQRPSFIRREIGMALIRDGALTRKEEDRLFEILAERRQVREEARER